MVPRLIYTDVVIIGAGPAGAAASFFLSKEGIGHIVIDKAVFPRDKVCGDACSGKTALVINRANPLWLTEILAREGSFLPSWGITFIAPNGKNIDIPFTQKRDADTKAPGFTTPRLVFDNFLFEKISSACNTIYQGAEVKAIQNNADGVMVEMLHEGIVYHIHAPLLIGADGDKGIVRRQLLRGHSATKASAVGLRAYYEGITGMNKENFIELHFLPEMLPGYLWIFPLPNGMANVGAGILSSRIRDKKINLREDMLAAIKNNPQIAPRFAGARLVGKIQGWGLPLAMGRQPISGGRILLTGDAACLVDPFSGEGIGNAMYSGMLAAAAIKEARAAKDGFSDAFLQKAYDDVVYKRLGSELRISATLQKLCRYPWLFNFVVNKAWKSPALRSTISCMFTDMDLRGKLSKPSFYFKILMNK